jgi:hypothetical protein
MPNKIAVLLLTAAAIAAPAFSKSGTPVRVKAHVTKSGTYVAPSKRTAPDKSRNNNWSTKGNTNPYTGKDGTKDPAKK